MKLTRLIVGFAFLLAGCLNCSAMKGNDQYETTNFEIVIARLGLQDAATDYSDSPKITIAKPTCAYINIEGTDKMPQAKTANMNVTMDIYTDEGVHFRKRAIISAQGNSSMAFPKKNFKADFCEDEWVGDKTTSITIGDWVKQDGFHFKAYYTDYLRGVAVVGYQLYDQIALNTGRLWSRAVENIPTPKENARCYPDGFPCVVYLNGNFYGIFAWQLKKHRDNMNQTKSVAEHIHLDGKIGNDTFWWEAPIDWTAFEVRNPKSLYTMDGKQYDGDHPSELIDETSECFASDADDETVIAAKGRSAQTKHYIEALHQTYNQIEELSSQQGSATDVCALIEEHFDLPSLIDYVCFHLAMNNYDGFRKNWQWFTYDGKKWFVAPYDLDCIFGNHFSGNYIIPAERNWKAGGSAWSFPLYGPMAWISKYYAYRIESRYKELRDAVIIDAENICQKLDDWYSALRYFYSEEWQQWPDSKCISETIVNDGWKLADTGYNEATWNDTTVYTKGDRCTLDGLAWEATETVSGIKPYAQLGYHDSLERYKEWIHKRISLLDDHYDYQSVTTGTDIVSMQQPVLVSVYDLGGRELSTRTRGLNICRYSNGTVKRVFVP